MKYTKEKLMEFEDWVMNEFNEGNLKSPVHLSRGDEDELIKIFEDIKPNDWVFSNYRSHYHALLKGIDPDWLKQWIKDNKSIHVMNKEHKFFTSAIVGGCLPIALGVAQAIKLKQDNLEKDTKEALESMEGKDWVVDGDVVVEPINQPTVWVFVGDMTGHTGMFWECIKYAKFHELPIKFVIADNGLSTDTPTHETWGVKNDSYYHIMKGYFDNLIYYTYDRVLPHYGTPAGFISKIWENMDKEDVRRKGF